MTRLRERYAEDRQKLGQAMMDLYKKEKVNPLGGCFPMLLQMPVFLALYWTLMESVELPSALYWLDYGPVGDGSLFCFTHPDGYLNVLD